MSKMTKEELSLLKNWYNECMENRPNEKLDQVDNDFNYLMTTIIKPLIDEVDYYMDLTEKIEIRVEESFPI